MKFVKIQSSTQWSNLYSNASKYNINVRSSRYKLAVYSFIGILTCLVILVSFTFHYNLALVLAVLSLISLSLFLSIGDNKPITSSFILTNTGVIVLDNETISYQLLAESRLSFIGCWLVLMPNSSASAQHRTHGKGYPKQFFIFRDSLHEQDFSRLARVINQLK
ncbi:protein YgfX [Colwellia sp. Bg11-28]|uniref:protein YgfX n=1 Tax=Colwellia sp. Bg11-28 TaxID=2058305 RepID=UPI002FCD7430